MKHLCLFEFHWPNQMYHKQYQLPNVAEKLAVVCAWDQDELLHLHLATAKAQLSITIQLRYKIRLIHNCSYFQ